MGFTYNISNDIGKTRLRIGDMTLNAGVKPDGTNFDDTEINYFLTVEGSVGRAAALACETLATMYAQVATLRTTPRTEELNHVSEMYQRRAQEMRLQFGQSLGYFDPDLVAPPWVEQVAVVGAADFKQYVNPNSKFWIRIGDSVSVEFDGLGSLAGRTALYLTVKTSKTDADTDAKIQVKEGTGLIRIAGAAGTAGNGSLTVNDETNGTVTFTLKQSETIKLAADVIFYDLKIVTATDEITVSQGVVELLATITAAVS